MLLGKRGRLTDDTVAEFRSTGTSHLLAISGLHVGSMVIMGLALASGVFGKRRSAYLLFPLALIWIYVLISCAPPSAIRAAIMGTVYLAALGLGRPRSIILPALALSAAAMAALNPQVLQQTSFQLSFGAMAGITLALPLQQSADVAISSRTAANPFRGSTWLSIILRWIAASLIISMGALWRPGHWLHSPLSGSLFWAFSTRHWLCPLCLSSSSELWLRPWEGYSTRLSASYLVGSLGCLYLI